MPTLLNFCRKLGWQLILNPDLVEEQVEHYQTGLKGGHTYVVLLIMLVFIATTIGFVMLSRYTNNTNAAQFHATTVSELIVHVAPVL